MIEIDIHIYSVSKHGFKSAIHTGILYIETKRCDDVGCEIPPLLALIHDLTNQTQVYLATKSLGAKTKAMSFSKHRI